MPSFARMLHHQLPPWETLEARLSFQKTTSQAKSSKWSRSKVVKGSPTAKSRLQENEVASNSETPFVTVESRTAEGNAASPIPHFEMNTFESVKTFIKGGRGGNVDEDGV